MHFRFLVATLLAWSGAAAAQTGAHYFEWPLHLPGVDGSSMVVGDVDGDGRKDFFWIERQKDYVDINNQRDHVVVLRQLPNGHFELPRTIYTCACPLRALLPFQADHDPGQEFAFVSAEYYGSGRAEFTVLDPTPFAGDAPGEHRIFGESGLSSTRLQALDLDLDGIDELFLIAKSLDTTPDHRMLFNLIVYRSDGGLDFTRIQRPPFSRPGDDPLESTFNGQVNLQHPDMDADGLRDVMFDVCPQACLFRHDPDGTLRLESVLEQPGGAAPGTIDAPTDRSNFVDLDQDGIPDRLLNLGTAVRLDLQTSKLNFQTVAEFQPAFGGQGYPDAADVDNNGFVDLVYAEGISLVAAMQNAPGAFTLKAVPNDFPPGSAAIVDINGDGCKDVLVNFGVVSYFRGRGCEPPSDLAVELLSRGGEFDVLLQHALGPRSFPDTFVRVLVAPTSDPTDLKAAKGLRVSAPEGCTRVAARAPRHLFDCRADMLAQGQATGWRFGILPQAGFGGWQAVHAVAFVLGGPADAHAENNVARATVTLAHRTTRSVPPSPPRTSPMRPGPAGSRSLRNGSQR